ncbi:MAG: LemA family protein [Ruminococcaceae bacterium]|nr:LemA family protein [Oscillospiraceae bacterium]
MANQLDELNPEIREEGLDTNVIAKKLPVKVGVGSTIFEILLWILGIIPGVIFLFMKIKAKNHFQQLEQKIQRNASQIDNYLEQRVVVLQNCAKLLDKAIELDKDTYENIARYRSGTPSADEDRNAVSSQLDKLASSVNVAFENYPDLEAHEQIEDAMQQNMYLQREITAARELYNDTINAWNRDVFAWPTKMIVAARNGYTTRIPFIASQEIKAKAKDVFF